MEQESQAPLMTDRVEGGVYPNVVNQTLSTIMPILMPAKIKGCPTSTKSIQNKKPVSI